MQCRKPRFDSCVGKIRWRRDRLSTPVFLGFSSGSAGKEFTGSAGNLGSIPGLGRSPGEGKGHPLEYSGLENVTDRGTWWAAFHGVTKSQHIWGTEHTHVSPIRIESTRVGAGYFLISDIFLMLGRSIFLGVDSQWIFAKWMILENTNSIKEITESNLFLFLWVYWPQNYIYKRT